VTRPFCSGENSCASSAPACCETYHAPAGRDAPDEFRRKVAVLEGTRWLGRALDAMPDRVMVLNGRRQIVAANEAFLTLTRTARAAVLEKRPGEAVGCIRAGEGPDGCGTAPHCVTCGAVNAILECLKDNTRTVRECRILAETNAGLASLDLCVTASPFEVDGERFILTVVEDISHAKRLAVIERLFFHDVLNTAGCIRGFAECLRDEGPVDRDTGQLLAELSEQLIEAIQAHRDLLAAESGDLAVQGLPIRTSELLKELRLQYQKHPVAHQRLVRTASAWDGTIVSDPQLLRRVLGNMIKNALEATAPGRTVTLSLEDRGDQVAFAVHNAEVMPEHVQYQIFQRSFSTKGETGRGVGTYSMKLLGERYLGGMLRFASTPVEGTTFTLTLPKFPRQSSQSKGVNP
jgi:hypothetical protein